MSIQPSNSPTEILQEAASRAKNMAVAAGMIVYLLLKLLVDRIIAPRLRAVGRWLGLRLVQALLLTGGYLQPHWSRFKEVAGRTRVKVVRRVLELLIAGVAPIEAALGRLAGSAKQRSGLLAEKGAVSLAVVLRATFNAIGALFRAGFSRPAVQALVQRLLDLAGEAQK